MNLATRIRVAYFSALEGLAFDGIEIPVFDEVVNPKVTLPTIKGAEVYVLLQDQQEYEDSSQVVCEYRMISNITVKVVTKWGLTGNKRLSEDIGQLIDEHLRGDRNVSKLEDIDRIELEISRSLPEYSTSNLAFSKILIYKNYIKK